MKKGIIALLVIALIFGLSSCSVEMIQKVAEISGKMGDNAYGIKANTAQATAAANALGSADFSDDKAVSDAAKAFIDSVTDIKGSDQKVEALKAELAKPADVEQSELTGALTSIVNDFDGATSAVTGEAKAIVDSVKAALDAIEISENPTQADLAMVAVLSHIATTAKDLATNTEDLITDKGLTEEGLGVVDSALGALDTLKVISEVAQVDILGDIKVSDLISQLGGTSKAIDAETAKYLDMVKGTVTKIFNLVTKDGKFDSDKYNSFIAECKALKASYDLVAAPYLSKATTLEDLDKILTMDIDHGFEIEEFVFYTVISAFVELDQIDRNEAYEHAGALKGYFEDFINVNAEAITDLGKKDFVEVSEEPKEAATQLLFEYLGVSGMDKLGDAALNDLVNGKLQASFFKLLGTATIIVVDSEFDGIFDLIPEQDGKKVNNISSLVASLIKEAE